MAANWTITNLVAQLYLQVLEILKERDLDAATAFVTPGTPPESAMRWNRVSNRWEEYVGNVWVGRTISVSGGGTGATDASGARAALGIGTMGTQQSNAVTITGGSITGLTVLGLTGHITFAANAQYDVGTPANRVRRIYIGGGAVAPVGVNKFVPV